MTINALYRHPLAVGMAVTGWLVCTPAFAGTCEPKTREDILAVNELTFVNETSATLSVTFYDNEVTGDTEVKTRTIAAGSSTQYKQKAESQKTHTAVGVIAAQGGFAETTCQVSVKKYSKSFPDMTMHTRWLSSDCAADGDTAKAYRATCERNYHPDSDRWKTVWTLSE